MIPKLFFGQRITANVLEVDVVGETDAGVAFTKLCRTNRYAPGEEAIFNKFYVEVEWETGPIVITFTPYVDERAGVANPLTDGVHILQQTLTLPAVTARTTGVFEIPIVEVFREASAEQQRERPRGKWFRGELSWASDLPCLIAGVDLEFEVVRETIQPQ